MRCLNRDDIDVWDEAEDAEDEDEGRVVPLSSPSYEAPVLREDKDWWTNKKRQALEMMVAGNLHLHRRADILGISREKLRKWESHEAFKAEYLRRLELEGRETHARRLNTTKVFAEYFSGKAVDLMREEVDAKKRGEKIDHSNEIGRIYRSFRDVRREERIEYGLLASLEQKDEANSSGRLSEDASEILAGIFGGGISKMTLSMESKQTINDFQVREKGGSSHEGMVIDADFSEKRPDQLSGVVPAEEEVLDGLCELLNDEEILKEFHKDAL